MHYKQISEHIWKLNIRMVVPIGIWLVKDEHGVALIDTGISVMSGNIMKYIKEVQGGRLQHILITHGHPDHVGGLSAILKQNDVPVYAHQTEIPYMEGDKIYPGKKKAKALVQKGKLTPLPEEDGKLVRLSGLQPYVTPGHSPGHVVYYHEEDDMLLAGDLFTTQDGRLKRPYAMFTPDMDQAVKSGEIVNQLKPTYLSPCHGGEVFQPHNQYEEYVENWEKKKRKKEETK